MGMKIIKSFFENTNNAYRVFLFIEGFTMLLCLIIGFSFDIENALILSMLPVGLIAIIYIILVFLFSSDNEKYRHPKSATNQKVSDCCKSMPEGTNYCGICGNKLND